MLLPSFDVPAQRGLARLSGAASPDCQGVHTFAVGLHTFTVHEAVSSLSMNTELPVPHSAVVPPMVTSLLPEPVLLGKHP